MALSYTISYLELYLRTQKCFVTAYSFMKCKACSFSPCEKRFMWMPLPFWNALFDLRLMPLESPSCDERKVRWGNVRPIRQECTSWFLLFWLWDGGYIYPLPFLPKGAGHWLTSFQIQCVSCRWDWPAKFLEFMTWFGTWKKLPKIIRDWHF